MIKFIRKKGQEELVGFVAIVVIAAIVLVIFLAIFLRSNTNNSSNLESREVYQFLEASMKYTSGCAVSFEPDFSDLRELLDNCLESKKCLNGRTACEELNSTLEDLIERSWKINSESYYKGFEFNAIWEFDSEKKEIINSNSGNCSSGRIGAEYISSSSPGAIISKMIVCT